jgi:hypothetical protein
MIANASLAAYEAWWREKKLSRANAGTEHVENDVAEAICAHSRYLDFNMALALRSTAYVCLFVYFLALVHT